MTPDGVLAEFETTGRLWLRGAVPEADLAALDALLQPGRAGSRLAADAALARLLGPWGGIGEQLAAIWPGMRPVRAVAFSKDAETNWGVPWHQDRIIAVRDRQDRAEFGNWSNKGGRWHCEPPLEILSDLLFVRIHLDAATEANGPMEIALGSHRQGVVRADQAPQVAESHPQEPCLAQRGDILVLKMLTLHRSGPSRDGAPRRALRVDYAARPLPPPLEWADL